MQPLNLKQAFDLITTVTGNVAGTRQDHFNIQTALQVIEKALFPEVKKEEVKKEKK